MVHIHGKGTFEEVRVCTLLGWEHLRFAALAGALAQPPSAGLYPRSALRSHQPPAPPQASYADHPASADTFPLPPAASINPQPCRGPERYPGIAPPSHDDGHGWQASATLASPRCTPCR